MKIKKLIFTILLTAIFSIPVYAVDFIVGAKGGYFVWKPYFEDIGGFFEPIDKGYGFLYGPAVSVLFTKDISLSVVGLTGTQSTYWTSDFRQEEDPDDVRAATYTWESKRYDIDSALSYQLLPYLKVFAGYKYQLIKSKVRYTEVIVDSTGQLTYIYHDNLNVETMSNGPAIGLGYSLLFGKGFFTAINASVIYMQGYFKIMPVIRYDYNSSTNSFETHQGEEETKLNIRQYGANFEPSIGYMPEGSGLVFTLGFRFQWLASKFYDIPEEEKEDFHTNRMDDYLYGIFISVLYSF